MSDFEELKMQLHELLHKLKEMTEVRDVKILIEEMQRKIMNLSEFE